MSDLFQPIDTTPRTNSPDAPDAKKREAERRPGGVALEEQSQNIDPQTIAAAVDSNRAVVVGTRNIEFSYDRDIDRVIVTVKSEDSEEVVRQIPPDEYLKFLSRFREAIGILFDEVA